MKKTVWAAMAISAIALCFTTPSLAGDPATTHEAKKSAPDDTGRNVRDSDGSTLTPGDQGDSSADVDTTRKIRQAVVADDALSLTAQNVKIITLDGVVTLRGPVKSQEEKQRIASAAEKVAGRGKVQDYLEIAQ